MLTGGTSAFPGWGLWLAAAIAITSIFAIALVTFAIVKRFRHSRPARTFLALLMLACCAAWIGYRIESNQRWASRSVVLEAADAFDGTAWNQNGLLRVSTRATDGCAQDNGASAQRQLLMPGPRVAFNDMTQAEYASALSDLDSSIRRLEAFGFSTERTTVEKPAGQYAVAWLTRGDEAIRIETAGTTLRIYGATNQCNSSLLLSWMDRADFVDVADYSIESVCNAALTELPDRCLQPN